MARWMTWVGISALFVGVIVLVVTLFFSGFGWLPHLEDVIPGLVSFGILIVAGLMLLALGWIMKTPSPSS